MLYHTVQHQIKITRLAKKQESMSYNWGKKNRETDLKMTGIELANKTLKLFKICSKTQRKM